MLKQYKINWCIDAVSTDDPTTDTRDVLLFQLISEIANDSNSSKLREDITKWLVGLEASDGKHGYDDDFHPIEVKPKNFTGKTKLNGGGQFTDFTWARDAKYSRDNVIMLISGFQYGKILFIVEFKYESIRNKIRKHLERILPTGDLINRYVRSASFSYLDWAQTPFTVKYLSPYIMHHKYCITTGLYKLLMSSKN